MRPYPNGWSRRPGRLVVRHEALDRVGAQQRDVAREEHERAAASGERPLGLEERVTRAELRLLEDEREAFDAGERGPDLVRLVPDDHRQGGRAERLCGPEDVGDDGTSHQRVEDLRAPRLHARALAGGEDDHVSVGIGHTVEGAAAASGHATRTLRRRSTRAGAHRVAASATARPRSRAA